MTLYDLYHTIQDIGIQLSSTDVPILKDGKEVNLDFHIVSEEGVVKHIEMIERWKDGLL